MSILEEAAPSGRRRHAAEPDRNKRRRRAAIILSTLIVLLVAATAVALFLLRANINGSVNSGAAQLYWSRSADFPTQTSVSCTDASGTAATSGPTPVTADLYTVGMNNAYTGAVCTYQGTPFAGTASTEDIRLTGDINLVGLPAGWEVALAPADCGKTITKQHPSTNPTGTRVSFTITKTAAATELSGGTINGPSSGIEAVPASQFDAGMCT